LGYQGIVILHHGKHSLIVPVTLAQFGTISKKNGTITPEWCQTPDAAPSATTPETHHWFP
jgi:hypothetical protein